MKLLQEEDIAPEEVGVQKGGSVGLERHSVVDTVEVAVELETEDFVVGNIVEEEAGLRSFGFVGSEEEMGQAEEAVEPSIGSVAVVVVVGIVQVADKMVADAAVAAAAGRTAVVVGLLVVEVVADIEVAAAVVAVGFGRSLQQRH
ncbi:hypothetical protein ACLB2K_046472 [Fragaria x ananassa]